MYVFVDILVCIFFYRMKKSSKPPRQTLKKVAGNPGKLNSLKPEGKIPRSDPTKLSLVSNSREHDVETELRRLAVSKSVCSKSIESMYLSVLYDTK